MMGRNLSLFILSEYALRPACRAIIVLARAVLILNSIIWTTRFIQPRVFRQDKKAAIQQDCVAHSFLSKGDAMTDEPKPKVQEPSDDAPGKGSSCLVWSIVTPPALFILYVLSLGPAGLIHQAAGKLPLSGFVRSAIEALYTPLLLILNAIEDYMPGWVENVLRWYFELWN
ncbi:MAG: hypothetical protein ACLFQ6_11245 [Candidatus Sumerlaeia bacterium]